MSGNVAIIVCVAIWLGAVLAAGAIASVAAGDTKYNKDKWF